MSFSEFQIARVRDYWNNLDCWRALYHLNGVDGVRYVRLGFGGANKRRVEVTPSAR